MNYPAATYADHKDAQVAAAATAIIEGKVLRGKYGKILSKKIYRYHFILSFHLNNSIPFLSFCIGLSRSGFRAEQDRLAISSGASDPAEAGASLGNVLAAPDQTAQASDLPLAVDVDTMSVVSKFRGVTYDRSKKVWRANAKNPSSGTRVQIAREHAKTPNAQMLCAQAYDVNELRWWGRLVFILKVTS